MVTGNKKKQLFSRFPHFKKPQQVVLYLRRLMKANLDGEIENETLRTHTVAAKAILSAIQDGDLESRVAALEKKESEPQAHPAAGKAAIARLTA